MYNPGNSVYTVIGDIMNTDNSLKRNIMSICNIITQLDLIINNIEEKIRTENDNTNYNNLLNEYINEKEYCEKILMSKILNR
jgi:hypothetical protein